MLCVAFLCLAAIFKRYSVPGLVASERKAIESVTSENVTPMSVQAQQVVAAAPVREAGQNSTNAQAASNTVDIDEPVTTIMPPVRKAGAKPDVKYYKGQKYVYSRTLRLRVTAYAPDARCCWPYDGKTTASGLSVKTNGGKLVAADTRLIPMHSLVAVPGYAGGAAVPVLDRGGAIKGHRLDVLLPTFDQAKHWGSRYIDVKVYEPAD
jgi:3D (Asp-Asp-Asp) domain-containing protein